MSKRLDLAGHTFGRLTAQSIATGTSWNCLCACGTSCIVPTPSLRSGNTKSCGCLQKEGPIPLHGDSKTALHGIWRGMLKRCNDPTDMRYGGRGIKVDPRWESYVQFKADMGERPPGKTLERMNNSKGYSVDNCCWATPKEQANNTRRSLVLTVGSVSKTLTQWAEDLGVPYKRLYKRWRLGWEPQDIVTLHV